MKFSKQEVLAAITAALFIIFVLGLLPAVIDFLKMSSHPRGVQGNYCINNLRQIDGAKQQWALENGKTNGDVCTENDIKPYIKLDAKGNFLKCPQGSIYTIGKVGEKPTCSLGTTVAPAHVLP